VRVLTFLAGLLVAAAMLLLAVFAAWFAGPALRRTVLLASVVLVAGALGFGG